ncbi:hypothetical protein GCM10029964_094540 [Kibdelosporangium lantanae]
MICAAALAMLRIMAAEGIVDHTAAVGKEIAAGVEELGHPNIAGVRGQGLLIGILLRDRNSKDVAAAAEQHGYLVNPPQPDVIRLAPPLILSHEDAARFVADLPKALS